MKTLKQIADELGISKDKVKYQSKKLPSKYLVKKEDGITYVTYAGTELIKKALGDKVVNVTQGNNQEITSELPKELTEAYLAHIRSLEEQIAAKDLQLERLDKKLENQQILTLGLQEQVKTLQLSYTEEKETKSKWKKFWSK